jgi:uncharacterized OsmC-like protein
VTLTTATALNGVDLAAVASLADSIQNDPRVGATAWHASVTWTGAFRSEANVRGFAPIRSDEPVALGGSDTAPNPVEQLLAAFGSCLAVGYAANATAEGIEIRDLRIELSGDLDLHAFLGLRPGHAGYDAVRVQVHLDSDATPEQLERLHEAVVGTSPVGHTLQAAIPVSIDLA